MPAGRTPIKTKWLTSSQRERAYDFIRRQVARRTAGVHHLPAGRGIGDAAKPRPPSRNTPACKQTIFPDLRLGLLHGRLSGEEKDRVMRAFSGRRV